MGVLKCLVDVYIYTDSVLNLSPLYSVVSENFVPVSDDTPAANLIF